ncbi:MAG: DUF2203 domain-containing protein [Caldilineales bacterium]|nr:DUF2203 domain-containing protein [Caldilineales bacterium]MDW8317658.1 DUF2203 domain-containing protein [Anaerolineae bacterium]
MPARFFTLEEANALLPQLNALLEQLMEARRAIVEARPDLWPVLKKAIGNGGSKKAGELLAEFQRLQQAYQDIEALGVLLKDPDMGLIDFLHRRPDGREVFLCWRYGEPEVAYWHELHTGFAGRKPV